jgi:hypothetical protein
MNVEQKDKLLLAVRSGTDLDTSCHYAGLSVAEVYRELERGKLLAENPKEGVKPSEEDLSALTLWRELASARADSVVRNVAVIQQAANGGSWQAAAWWLERSVPENYSKTYSDRKPIDKRQTPELEGQ